MSLISLTKNGGNVLVNVNQMVQVETIRLDNGSVLSKIFLSNGQYCLVEEPLQEIHDIVYQASVEGEKQSVDWTKTSVVDFFENERRSFQRPYQKRSYTPREKNYNY